ncbi:histidine kinase [Mucilaginibacter sp. 21P]|uniref:sensor histidine kinase n=1 Tax=Mucilaginibacter sp. 21P TaxID=2778902 RepID=UPI001C562F1F|nr:histidine kinase [Mucilaginibacter sp. 21P]QXV66861.1 histidine kinase [Mucilaginibacter sp. 21P]
MNQFKFYKTRTFQELIIFVAMFVLTMLHEWMKMDTLMDLVKGLIFFSLLYGQAQLHRRLLFPLFLAKRHKAYFFLFVISTLIVSAILMVLDYYWIAPEIFGNGESLIKGMLYHFVLCIISTFTILSIFLVRQYSSALQKRNEAQLLLSEINLKFMHAQLNPHFFFNMFNNLYAVSLTDPGRTPNLILKLSALMRYQLESGTKDQVSIPDELQFIDNYIAMEQERVGKRCKIEYLIEDEVRALRSYTIAPLILITLVENAFKHSVTATRDWFVHIKVRAVDGRLYLYIENSMPDQNLTTPSTGIGLVNIRERLKMLYDGKYELSATSDAEIFRTRLFIQLNALAHG